MDDDGNGFGIRRNPQVAICLVHGIELSIDTARQIGIELTLGYFFRLTTPSGWNPVFSSHSSTAEARLKTYLLKIKADEGKTLHGFRSGCAITLALTGADLSEIMDHIG